MRDLEIKVEDGILYIEGTNVLVDGTLAPLVYIYCLVIDGGSKTTRLFFDVVVKEKI